MLHEIQLIGNQGLTAATGANYNILSGALATITDASDSNEYLLVVHGEIVETAAVTAKSHVHVWFTAGSCLIVTSTSTLNAVNFSSLTNTVWAAADPNKPCIRRTGAVGGACRGLYITGCDSTVRLHNLYMSNETTGVGGCHGIYNLTSSSPTMTNCTGTGGSGGATSIGIYNTTASSPTMTNCVGIGGGGGAACSGIVNERGSSPTMDKCIGIGGGGGSICYGIQNYGSCSPRMTSCTGIGGAGGVSCYGLYFTASSSPVIIQCVGIGGGAQRFTSSSAIAASTRTEDAFLPGAGYAYRLLGVSLLVATGAAAGVTLTLRDATGGGGNALSAAQAVTTVGWKYFPITGHRVIAADASVYARLSAEDATLAYTIYYVYEKCYATCYGLYHDSDAAVRIQDCTFLSNAASAAVYVTNNGDDLSMFIGGTARSGLNDAARSVAFSCQSAWNPGQVYQMVLDGGVTNLTAAAGTANGSNIIP